MSSPNPNLLTPGEYLDLERKSEIRNEYIAGRIFAMSGASRRHGLIAGNFFRELSSQLRGRACEAYVSDLRVKVSPTGMYRETLRSLTPGNRFAKDRFRRRDEDEALRRRHVLDRANP